MKIIIFLSLFFSNLAYSLTTIHLKDDRQVIGKTQNEKVERLAKSICGVGKTKSAKGCCSGALVAPDIVMTNFHCLSCIHKDGPKSTLLGKISSLLNNNNSSRFGLGALPTFSDHINHLFDLDQIEEDTPQEIMDQLNQNPEGMYYVNFSLVEGHEQNINGSRIKKILALSKEHDFAFIQLEKTMKDVNPLKLSKAPIERHQSLINISLPSKSPAPNFKVVDFSKNCKITKHESFDEMGRSHNFGHTCDTNPGSSGSPLIDKKTEFIVGLHWAGGAKMNENDSYNKAIKTSEILKELEIINYALYLRLKR